MAKVGVVGTTSWGTTLATLLAEGDNSVMLWTRTPEEADVLREDGENKRFLPGVKFPPNLIVTYLSEEAFSQADLVLIAVPSSTFRDNIRRVASAFDKDALVVSATKGLEISTGLRMSQVLVEELPRDMRVNICVLSGPNLAGEIVQGKPSSTVIASQNPDAAMKAQEIINSPPKLRVYTNDDIVGVEFGGALKNIIALGAGICDGKGLGDNAKAAFMTRGLAETGRLAAAAGANPLTLAGLAGLGDLVATCSSRLSRNHQLGEQLAQGKSLAEIRKSMVNVAEGVNTTAAAMALSRQLGVEMPITQAMYSVLFEGVPIEVAITNLMERSPRPE
ncbi:MAG: glycerol-3-phosphate dehydrogenase [SAR202 cluster bacterium Casp-Chloro-G4]|nr:NAD(P)-dependent glycerol-3-phosphate dehydrogenase [Chloroflexota bacterium]PKB61937.1 MAG: glycerol-3-phosphate dehydrogenase [SAR202 cluster bacterium Casp-Chloro-G4]